MATHIGRPVIVPRGPITPFGAALRERDVSPKAMGQAIAIAEHKPQQVPTVKVNRWVWGTARPAAERQVLIAEILEAPVDELFPPVPRDTPQPELELLTRAREHARRPRRPSPAAGAAHLDGATAQQKLSSAVSSTHDNGWKGSQRESAPGVLARKRRAPKSPTARKAA